MSLSRVKLPLLFLLALVFPLTAQSSSITSEGYLRSWQDEESQFQFSAENGMVSSIVTADDERFVLRKYDSRYRLISETVWNAGSDVITTETVWTYPETGVFPLTMTKSFPGQEQTVKVLYASEGREAERSVWQQGGSSENGQSDRLMERTTWQYDSENRVVSRIHELFETETDASRTERTEYAYSGNASEPDMSYYENDVLIEKVVRHSDDSYTESLFFEDMEIRSIWENGVKIDEVYYLDGKEQKRKPL